MTKDMFDILQKKYSRGTFLPLASKVTIWPNVHLLLLSYARTCTHTLWKNIHKMIGCLQIASLTNEFYHLVPVGGFEYEVIRPIRDRAVLKEHLKLVTDLLDMEIASKILLGSQLRLKGSYWPFLCSFSTYL